MFQFHYDQKFGSTLHKYWNGCYKEILGYKFAVCGDRVWAENSQAQPSQKGSKLIEPSTCISIFEQ